MGNEQLLEKAKEGLEKLPEIRVKHLPKLNESVYAYDADRWVEIETYGKTKYKWLKRLQRFSTTSNPIIHSHQYLPVWIPNNFSKASSMQLTEINTTQYATQCRVGCSTKYLSYFRLQFRPHTNISTIFFNP